MKRISILLCNLLAAIACSGQISIGAKAGLNSNDIIVNPEVDVISGYNTEVSFHAGVFAKFGLNKKIAIIPEVQFIQKVSSASRFGDKAKLSYLEVPLIFSYQPLNWLSVEAGGSVGFRIGGNIERAYNGIDAGGLGGFRFNVSKKIAVLARYYHGLSAIERYYFSNSIAQLQAETKLQHRGFQLSLVYYLKEW